MVLLVYIPHTPCLDAVPRRGCLAASRPWGRLLPSAQGQRDAANLWQRRVKPRAPHRETRETARPPALRCGVQQHTALRPAAGALHASTVDTVAVSGLDGFNFCSFPVYNSRMYCIAIGYRPRCTIPSFFSLNKKISLGPRPRHRPAQRSSARAARHRAERDREVAARRGARGPSKRRFVCADAASRRRYSCVA